MNLNQVIEWFAVGVGYGGFIGFIVIAVRWTGIIRQYDNLAEEWEREKGRFPPDYFRRNIARVTDGAKEARKNRRVNFAIGIVMLVYGTVMVRLAVIG